MSKTHRTNAPVKRYHWHSARTERRGRFSRGWFWAQDEDLAFRRTRSTRGRGRGLATGGRAEWITADKARIRWLLSHGRISDRRAAWLKEKLHIDA